MYEKYVGNKFNRLEIIGDGDKKYYVKCKCECGNIKEIRFNLLKGGFSKSCGCLQREKVSVKKYKGLDEKFRGKFKSIKRRCNCKNYKLYKDYGGRGIKCEWKSFEEFYNDMFESYLEFKKFNDYVSIDRIDVNGNYCKENCKWATREEQNSNKRNTYKTLINGEMLTIPEIIEKYFYDYDGNIKSLAEKIRWRINKGWEGEQILLINKYLGK